MNTTEPQIIKVGHTPFLDTSGVAAEINEAIAQKRPFSLVRLGDGESFVLGYEDTTKPEEIELILGMWFGPNKIDREDVLKIRSMLLEAIQGCDILGIPDNPKTSEKFRRVAHNVNRYGLWDGRAKLCSHEVHMTLHEEHKFSGLLTGLDFLGLITPRDLNELVKKTWGIGQVERWSLPEEYHYARDKGSVKRHYPDRFKAIMQEIDVPYPGAVFLVGAGVLGKIYCHRIKELGGIAIDIGSTFDAWASFNARGNVKRMRLGL